MRFQQQIFILFLNLQPCNQAPEDFRKYLVKKGVMDYISKYFQKLMKERPENPIEILQQNNMKEMEIEELKRKLDEANDVSYAAMILSFN